ncbi:hypothetical protein JX266_003388 [Neoarthrinium moseri]|nr:hypothetical protein JX266_003388 [Neoarthrinium moseri]
MSWPYQFLDLTSAEKQERRLALDRYAALAQLSALLPVVVFLLLRVGSWVVGRLSSRGVAYDAVPNSPAAKHEEARMSASLSARARRLVWWLTDDFVLFRQNWGRRDQLLFGAAWTLWLLFLCVHGTGNDYFHLTKRFGAIAAAQFPVQYLLALKYLNPVAFAFRSSHEEVNRWHRALGRIIYILLCLHGMFYLNYYVQSGVLTQRLLSSLVVILGVSSLFGMTLLNTTALSMVRQYSYRVFFITHLLVALALPPAIFFHVRHARVYMIESLVFFILDLALRKMHTAMAEATLELIPGTNLIKIVSKVPQRFAARFDFPGSHVYLSIPAASRPISNRASPSHMLYEFLFNPFTVASINEETHELTLVARQLKGPMTQTLGSLANSWASGTKIPLTIEGPYGISRYFPSFARTQTDRVLLVAGGVGATFIVPIYQQIIGENPAAHVDMIWAVREAGEATWTSSGLEKTVLDDERIQLFLTGNVFDSDAGTGSSSAVNGEIELENIRSDRRRSKRSPGNDHKRPDLQQVVNRVFRQGHADRVAVLVCGPDSMARELRQYVGVWVKKGRNVYFHNENFSW